VSSSGTNPCIEGHSGINKMAIVVNATDSSRSALASRANG
jgi:hypothetical protein